MSYKNTPYYWEIKSKLYALLQMHEKSLTCINQAGKIYRDIGELSLSKDIHSRVIKLSEEKGYKWLLMESLVDLGTVERDLGQTQIAEDLFKRSWEIVQELGSDDWKVEILRSLAYLYIKLARLRDVESSINFALLLKDKVKDKKILANLLAVCGNYYHHIGNIQTSHDFFVEALEVARQVNFQQRVATVLGDLGTLYLSQVLNDPEKAKAYLLEALSEGEKVKYTKSILATLWRLADLEEKNYQNSDKALEYYGRAYELALKTGFKREQADSLVGLGNIAWAKSSYELAFEKYYAAKAIFNDLGYIRDSAYLLEKEGDLLASRNVYLEAAKKYEEASATFEDILFIENVWDLHKKAGKMYEATGDRRKAYLHYDTAITTVEKMRSTIANESQKMSFVTRRLSVFEAMVILCLKLSPEDAQTLNISPLEKALEFIERAKSRALIDMLGNVQIMLDDVVDQQLQQKRSEIERKLDLLLDEVKKNPSSIKRRDAFIARRRGLVKEYQGLYTEWLDILETLKKRHPEFSTLKQVSSLSAEEIITGTIKNKNSTLLEFFIAENHLVVLILYNDSLKSHIFDFGEIDFGLKTNDFLRELISVVEKDEFELPEHISYMKSMSAEIYNLIIKPIEVYFSNAKLITIVPHGFLHNFPFHALFDSEEGKYLGEKYEVNYSPSATILKFCKEKENKQLTDFLGLGNPKTLTLEPLPGAEEEVRQISSLFENAKILINENATRESFFAYAPRYDAIHFACHGYFDTNFPLLSRLYLTPDGNNETGHLIASDVFNIKLRCGLVTLSACESGVSEVLKGDEVLGFIRAFLYAGSPSMLVSLWKIADKITLDLMRIFYWHWLKNKSKSEAMKNTIEYFINSDDLWLQHPFSWAGFILVGDNS